MASPIDPVALAAELIRCPSITPARGEVFDLVQAALEPMGFTVHRWVLGEAPDGPTENMVAIRGSGSPHFGFAGHLDVVPAGDGWTAGPFDAQVIDGQLVGRGANNMKSAIAAFIAAVSRVEQTTGTLTLLLTGDEEGYATYGTPRIIDWLNERSIRPDMILIGEPTSVESLGDTVKIGRRGSVNMWIDVPGVQGHVAYPHRASNPVGPLARVITALGAVHLDDGTDVFPPSNLEFTAISTPTDASNVIPGAATAQLNIRFNNLHRGSDLVRMVEEIAGREAPGATVRARISGEAFLTPPGELYDLLLGAIRDETGLTPNSRPAAAPPTGASDPALSGGRLRPAERDHAQARRKRRGSRHPAIVEIYERIVRKVLA